MAEFTKLIPMLTRDADRPFHVVCPSLPGYAWSSMPGKIKSKSFWEIKELLGVSNEK